MLRRLGLMTWDLVTSWPILLTVLVATVVFEIPIRFAALTFLSVVVGIAVIVSVSEGVGSIVDRSGFKTMFYVAFRYGEKAKTVSFERYDCALSYANLVGGLVLDAKSNVIAKCVVPVGRGACADGGCQNDGAKGPVKKWPND